MSAEPRIAVCVSTLHRPDGLERVLKSLVSLALPEPAPAVTLVVVNNDPDDERPSAICDRARESSPHEIELLDETERGLAVVRNRALDHAIDDHDFIAFIDDDSIAEPCWLAELLEVQRRCDADAVTGPTTPGFETAPPDWVERGGFFARRSRPTGTVLTHAFTNNVLIRSNTLRETALRFDPAYGLIGGEDTHFFRRLRRAGAKIVWADEAVVEDLIPEERATARWLLMRHHRTGMTTARIERELRPVLVAIPLILVRGAASLALGAAIVATGIVAGRHVRMRGRCWLAWGRGLIEGLFGRVYSEYAHER